MLYRDPVDGVTIDLPPPPAPVPVTPPVAAPKPAPVPPVAPVGVNSNGETLEQAEAAIRALVAQGMTGADALARHPLPPGTPVAVALNFLASLPQTVYSIDSSVPGVVVGPPIDTQPGFIPYDDGDFPDDEGTEAGDDEYAEWDDLVDLLEDALGAPL